MFDFDLRLLFLWIKLLKIVSLFTPVICINVYLRSLCMPICVICLKLFYFLPFSPTCKSVQSTIHVFSIMSMLLIYLHIMICIFMCFCYLLKLVYVICRYYVRSSTYDSACKSCASILHALSVI